MKHNYLNTKNQKFNRLSFEHYDYVIREVTKYATLHGAKRRNTGRTALIKRLANDVLFTMSSNNPRLL